MSPYAPGRPCAAQPCPNLVFKKGIARCERHQSERGSAWTRGYNTTWFKVRAAALERDGYICVICAKSGFVEAATEVDHIVPFSGKNDANRTRLSNLQSLCESCHSRKTASENFGRE
jgi:5-methylcytosine-specific restriction enzyme A